MRPNNLKEIPLMIVFTVLCIACFPANPLVFAGVIKTNFYLPLFIAGWAFWAFGMVLVMAPIILFPKRGGVPKGRSFVHTARLVNTGIYSVIRHPQYTGGIYAIFVTTLLWYPHWLFAVLGVAGTVLIYFSTRAEDHYLIEKFGDDYKAYMQKVPGMNFVSGITRLLRKKGNAQE